MPSTELKATLSELHQALEGVDDLDPAMLDLLKQVDGDIHALLESQQPADDDASALLLRVEKLGASFAARHPHTERFFQELITTLGRLGI